MFGVNMEKLLHNVDLVTSRVQSLLTIEPANFLGIRAEWSLVFTVA